MDWVWESGIGRADQLWLAPVAEARLMVLTISGGRPGMLTTGRKSRADNCDHSHNNITAVKESDDDGKKYKYGSLSLRSRSFSLLFLDIVKVKAKHIKSFSCICEKFSASSHKFAFP